MNSDSGAVAFAEKLFLLLDHGLRTSTYKYAVLLGLIDLCLEHSTDKGEAPSLVTTAQLARKVTATYWRHTTPYERGRERVVLKQNKGGQGEILQFIADVRENLPDGPLLSYGRARARHPDRIASLERKVEWKLVQMPLPRLQWMGDSEVPFIYRIQWTKGVRLREFNSPSTFDNAIRFVPGAAEHLVRLAPLLRPLIQKQWVAMVSQLNRLAESQLEAHLFERDRIALTKVAGPLRELQDGRCLYCEGRLTSKTAVDHFIPWSRHPDDGLDNLVAAHERCNGDKSDFLASTEHVRAWVQRNERRHRDLDALAAELRWEREPGQTVGTARGIYLRLSNDVRLWRAGRELVPADHEELESVFRAVA